MIGSTFGLLTVTGKDLYAPHLWVCRCTCGTDCLRTTEQLDEFEPDCGQAVKHVLQHQYPREYTAYNNMLQRCTNPRHKKFHRYGGRGITVCEAWRHSFRLFIESMGPCPPNYSIERKDNDGNYEPGNCEWIPTKNQWRNKSKNKYLTWKGQKLLFTDACRAAGLPPGTVRARIQQLGWDAHEALTIPLKNDYRHRSRYWEKEQPSDTDVPP